MKETRDTGQFDAHAEPEVEITDLDQHGDHRRQRFARQVNDFFERRFGTVQSRRRAGIFVSIALVLLALLIIASAYEGDFLRLFAGNAGSNAATAVREGFVSHPLPVPESLAGSNPFTCIMDASWSPDSRTIAILGYTNGCPASPSERGLLAVYDVHTGRLIRQIRPDVSIVPALRGRFARYTTLFYDYVLWSPDGSRLAILFAGDAEKFPPLDGLLLIDRDGGHPEVILHEDLSSTLTYEYFVWDTVQRRPARIAYVPVTPGDYVVNVPVAQSYHWGANGALLPDPASTSAQALTGPVGNPDGGSSFTPWQSGSAVLTFQNGNSPAYLPGVYTWNTYFAAWSPDGRYIVDGLNIVGRLTSPALPPVSKRTLAALQAGGLSVLPVRDKGLGQALSLLKVPTGAAPGAVGILVAWRPDGRVVAVNDSENIDIYDCSTGRLLAALPMDTTNVSGAEGMMYWSPDGSRLLLPGGNGSAGIIWGPRQLPRADSEGTHAAPSGYTAE